MRNKTQEKRMALRSLMNIRMPGWMKDDVIRVQDELTMRSTVLQGCSLGKIERVIFNVFKNEDKGIYIGNFEN